jgi:Lon protease-like protein
MTRAPEHAPEEPFVLPLFPLNLVLYPGMVLPLHIFEERYRAMIGDCLDQKKPFGVILIKEGQEVGGSAVPVAVGTTARILDVQALEDGRMNILTRGERRFELRRIVQSSPYMTAEVVHLRDDADEKAAAVLAKMRAEYTALLQGLATLSATSGGDMHVPVGAVPLSFAIAAKLATTIRFPVAMRQEWLECACAHDRLSRLGPVLEKVNKTLAAEILKRRPDHLLLN